MGDVELRDVTKIYDDAQGTETAVDNVSFHVQDGELLVIVGPSGCGKSTTLRAVAGLEPLTDGEIWIGGKEVQHLAAKERSIAMAFQNFALYRKMTVESNLEYGLKHSTYMTKAERKDRVQEVAEMLEITELFDHYPDEISGGQKQRVALGRAIVREPEAFLLDEPLSNLDAKLRATLRTELQEIHDEFGVTMIYVTHDQTEAMALADRIVVMNDAEVQQIAPPGEAYHNPSNKFVATFLGSPAMNVLRCGVTEGAEEVTYTYRDVSIATVPQETAPETPQAVEVGFRPNEVTLHDSSGPDRFPADVDVNEYQGKERYMYLELAQEEEIIVRAPATQDFDVGETVWISLPSENVYLFDPDSGEALQTKWETTSVPDSQATSSPD